MINCKVELKRKWAKCCVLAATVDKNDNANSKNITFTIKNIKLYVPVLTISATKIQKLSKLLSKGFESSVYWDEYKTNKKE